MGDFVNKDSLGARGRTITQSEGREGEARGVQRLDGRASMLRGRASKEKKVAAKGSKNSHRR